MQSTLESPALPSCIALRKLAKRLDVSTRTVKRWSEAGRLPPIIYPAHNVALLPLDETRDALRRMGLSAV